VIGDDPASTGQMVRPGRSDAQDVALAGIGGAVEDEGRTLDVETLAGERLRFRLNATGWFVTADRSARLQLTAAD
jgi:hypothetical protein